MIRILPGFEWRSSSGPDPASDRNGYVGNGPTDARQGNNHYKNTGTLNRSGFVRRGMRGTRRLHIPVGLASNDECT
jgi:hypothetical protein